MQTIHTTTIRFPELKLHPSAGHKLRGYFGNLFKERSPLLHNHLADGRSQYRYPLVQYKVIDKIPTLVGIEEGATLLAELFLSIKELRLEAQTYPLYSKNITTRKVEVGVTPASLQEYCFKTLWFSFNERNYRAYQNTPAAERTDFLQRILVGNILSFFKGVDYRANERILVKLNAQHHYTQFKNQKMQAFSGSFVTNVSLPDGIGLGKSVARGYGAVLSEK